MPRVARLLLLAASLAAAGISAGCGQSGGAAIIHGTIAVIGVVQHERRERIMGRPETVEASHAAAIASDHPDYQAELIQPEYDDPTRWAAYENGGERPPAPANER